MNIIMNSLRFFFFPKMFNIHFACHWILLLWLIDQTVLFHRSLSANVYAFYCFDLRNVALFSGEKRKLPETLTLEDAKRIRVMGDIPMELVNEVMMTITDPAAMLGPEVSWLNSILLMFG